MDLFQDQRKNQLLEALRNAGAVAGGARGGRAAAPLFGGRMGGHLSGDYPQAALPGLSFNPFLAQVQRGLPNLAPQTSGGAPDSSLPYSPGAPPSDSFSGQAQAEANPSAYSAQPYPSWQTEAGAPRSLVGVGTGGTTLDPAIAAALAARLARLGGGF